MGHFVWPWLDAREIPVWSWLPQGGVTFSRCRRAWCLCPSRYLRPKVAFEMMVLYPNYVFSTRAFVGGRKEV